VCEPKEGAKLLMTFEQVSVSERYDISPHISIKSLRNWTEEKCRIFGENTPRINLNLEIRIAPDERM